MGGFQGRGTDFQEASHCPFLASFPGPRNCHGPVVCHLADVLQCEYNEV